MIIEQLKSIVESKGEFPELMIFEYSGDKFLVEQYIKEISKIKGKEIVYLDGVENIISNAFMPSTNIRVVFIDKELDFPNPRIKGEKNLIIVTPKVSKDTRDIISEYIIDFPKLEKWQIKNYIQTISKGVDVNTLDSIIEMTNYNIYRLFYEFDKLKNFTETERYYLLKEMVEDGAFSDCGEVDSYALPNALWNKDLDKIKNAYMDIMRLNDNSNKEMIFKLIKTLYNNTKQRILVSFLPNANETNTGMSNKQIYGIKKNTKMDKRQLLEILKLFSNIHERAKVMNNEMFYSYLICKVLTI